MRRVIKSSSESLTGLDKKLTSQIFSQDPLQQMTKPSSSFEESVEKAVRGDTWLRKMRQNLTKCFASQVPALPAF